MTEVSNALPEKKARTPSLAQKITFAIFRIFLTLSACLPLSTSRWIGRKIGWLYYKLAKKRVHIARVNIDICFPELTANEKESRVKNSIEEAGSWFMEAGAIWMWSDEKILKNVQFKNIEVFNEAVALNKGVILAIPHLGNWEIMGPAVSLNNEFACFYKHDEKNHLFSEFLIKQRSRNGTVMASADPSGVRCLYKHLKAGKVIGLLPDHNPSAEMGVFAPFFEKPALTGTLISSLAKKNNATVLSAAAIRTEAGFEIYFAKIPNQHSEDKLLAATSVNKAIEDCIRLAPEQFQWVYPRFNKRQDPSTQASPYR